MHIKTQREKEISSIFPLKKRQKQKAKDKKFADNTD